MMSASTVVARAGVGTMYVRKLRARGDAGEVVEEAVRVEGAKASTGGCRMEGGAVGVDEVDEGALLGHQCGGMRSHTGGNDLLVPFSFGFISCLPQCFVLLFFFTYVYVVRIVCDVGWLLYMIDSLLP